MAEPDDKLRGHARLASDIETIDIRGGEKNTDAAGTAFDRPADRFETVGELGRGGMGRVDDAFDRTLGRPVAIKHMLAQNAVDFARFEREARITARLEHPGIVPVHETGRSPDGTPYYVMRRVDGLPLSQLVADKRLAERLALIPNVLAACDAVAFAHARRIIHRDIKPTNILVGPFGETLVIDWGLARELGEGEQAGITNSAPSDQNLTRAGTVAGTPGFMAPEQARGEAVDASADVFALGATLFYVLSGQLPWGTTSATELVNLAGTGRAPDWKRVPDEVPPDLRAVLEKAMAVDPANRYPDAGALAADLRRFTLGNLVGAYEYGPIAKLVRYARRHRAAVGVGLVSIFVLAIVAVISVRRVVAERDDATAARGLAETQKREATAMADQLLVAHARELAEVDPAGAIATLRRLRPESERWREAWSAAATAYLRGIPTGFAATGASEANHSAMLISPDNRHALVMSHQTGDLQIFDLVDRTRREVAHGLGMVASVSWLGARYVVFQMTRDKTIAFVDVTTGQLTQQPAAIRNIVRGRGDKVWIEYLDGRVVELTDPQSPPTTLMTNVEALYAAQDLRSAVVRRANGLEVWTPDKVYPLSVKRAVWAAWISEGTIIVLDAEEVHIWKLDHGALVEDQVIPREKSLVHFRVIDGVPAAITPYGIRGYPKNGPTEIEREPADKLWDTAQGFLFSTFDGRIIVRDADGRFEIGKRPVSYARIDLSEDRRWLAGLATTGDLLVWDLNAIRPKHVPVQPLEQPILLSGNQLWLLDMVSGARKLDLATGQSKQIIDGPATPDWSLTGYLGNYIAAASFHTGEVSIYDDMRDVQYHFRGVTAASEFNVGLLLALDDGRLVRWRVGETTTQLFAKLPEPPDLVAASGRYVVARNHETELIRISEDQKITRATFERPVGEFAIDRAASVWLVSGGKAFRWDVGGTPVEIEAPGFVDDLLPLKDSMVLHCATSLVVLRGGTRRVIPLTSSSMLHVTLDELVVYETPHYEVGLVDLATGSSVLFPQRKQLGAFVAADDKRVVFRDQMGARDSATVVFWTLDVPHEPAALRAWFDKITNAKALPNSDAVAYP